MLKLILGTAGTGKTSYINNEIKNIVLGKKDKAILIVPEQYSFEAERELCSVCGDSMSMYAEVLSFSRLAMRVEQEVGGNGKVPLDKGGRLLCMSLALNQISHRLKLYPAAGRKAELQQSLLDAVDELKTAGVDEERLIASSALASGSLRDKLSDLSLCLSAYEAVLSQGHADPVDRIRTLADKIALSSFAKCKIYIDGFTYLTAVETAVADSLLNVGADITVCFTCDDLFGNSEHFNASRKSARKLYSLAENHKVETEIVTLNASEKKDSALSFYNQHLFSFTSDVHEDEKESIKLFCCNDIRTECELAASLCLELVRTTGCRWRDIAISSRSYEKYASTLETIFERYNIPLFTARRDSILHKSLPALVGGVYRVISGGWDLDDVLECIKTGLTGLSPQEEDALCSYAFKWNIKGNAWSNGIEFKGHPDGFGGEFDEDTENKLALINSARNKFVSPLLKLQTASDEASTALSQLTALTEYFSDISLPQTLEERTKALNQSGYSLLAAEYSQLWGILVNSMEQFAAILGDMPLERDEFISLFTRMLSGYGVSAIPVSQDSVSAGDMERVRKRNLKHLIILGASDNSIPQFSPDSGIISDDDRDNLHEMGIDLISGDKLSLEFSLIYNCVSLPSESLTLSYCATDENGAQNRPSLLVSRAEILFDKKVSTFDVSKARLASYSPAFMLAAGKETSKEAMLARAYFDSLPEEREHLSDLIKRSNGKRGKLSADAVDSLYGKKMRLSPSRTDSFTNCRLSYFLRYGLKLKEQTSVSFDPPEMGIFTHYVLENVARDIRDGQGFHNADSDLVDSLCEKYTDLYIKEHLGGFDDKSPRFIHLFQRQRPAVKKIVSDMAEELKRSDFVPLDFELGFGKELPAVRISSGDSELIINGIADRVDGCEIDGKLYIRVIDYKTGQKSFDFSDIYSGLSLQMLIYLYALQKYGKSRYGLEIVPAGVMYIPARDEIIKSDTNLDDETLLSKRQSKLKRSGLILNEEKVISAMEKDQPYLYIPVSLNKNGSFKEDTLATSERFTELKDFVTDKLIKLTNELREGKIDPNPLFKGSSAPCQYCRFKSICRFDEERDFRRYLKKIKPAEFWKLLEESHE